ncbi:putative methyltransferase-domain-containing protein [Lipomyces arxii]|uniref:putative methyltransferase-domain-containing protein n=1 Tax=Lipomyces arxii TaxID=56418 RepID=UPI0034CF808E
MFHIRFLKVPYIKPLQLASSKDQARKLSTRSNGTNGSMKHGNGMSISKLQDSKTTSNFAACTTNAVVTLTTELGDDFFYGNVSLRVQLMFYSSDKVITVTETRVRWKTGMRAISIELEVPTKQVDRISKSYGKDLRYHMRVTADTDNNYELDDEAYVDSDGNTMPVGFLSIESMGFFYSGLEESSGIKQANVPRMIKYDRENNRYVKRELKVGSKHLQLVEEIGDSMAKHLWDSGIFLSNYITSTKANYAAFIDKLSINRRPENIVELGCGCGTVGLVLSKVFQFSNVLLTDLDSGKEVCERNIALNTTKDDAERRSNRKVEFCCFDWETSNNTEEENAKVIGRDWDLVVSCDCTYNSDSFDVLTDVLLKLLSPHSQLLLVHKERHSSEDRVFDMLRDKNGLELAWRKLLEPIGAKSRVDLLLPIG